MRNRLAKVILSLIVIIGIATPIFFTNCIEGNQAGEPKHAHYGKFDEVIHGSASRINMSRNLDELEYWATHIVRGRVGDDSRMALQFNQNEPTWVVHGHNLVSLEILDVIMGDIGTDDYITIIEPFYIVDGTLYTIVNYLPSIPQHEYIFFLHIQDNPESSLPYGAFWILDGYRSRFPVVNNSNQWQRNSAIDLALGQHGNEESYMNLWQEVMDAFMNP